MFRRSGHSSHLPEWEDDDSGDYKDDGKNHKDDIWSLFEVGVVQNLPTLRNNTRKDSAMVAVMAVL